MKVLIAYDTTEGQTRKIAQYASDSIRRGGHDAQLIDIRRPPSGFVADGFDAILVGASIHLGKHSRRLSEFVRRHQARLKAVPSGFFSVSLSAAGSDKEQADADRFVEEFLQQADWSPAVKAIFAGGLLYREYGLLKRWMMKKIAQGGGKDTDTSKNHEYTDWTAVDRFVGGFLAGFEPRQVDEGNVTI
ncbi:MAG: menaquinone-dependent protoporphyrinogen IX dehydrogenase [Pirellulaceae bacterium]|nr:menaquinone-dependent protoporphyrinogen IX dehydrogenase [Pirellulaceae bacterium]